MKYDSTKDTLTHIFNVQEKGSTIISMLSKAFVIHDRSKLNSPKKEIFDEFTPKLKYSTYGSEEYNEFLKDMKPALTHHYLENRHHPEHHRHGIKSMNLVDITEMLVDWLCASERHDDGNIGRSIEYNSERFKYSHDVKRIFVNTIMDMYKYSIEFGIGNNYGIYYGNTIDELHRCIKRDKKNIEFHDYIKNGYYHKFHDDKGNYEYNNRYEVVDNCMCIEWRVQE